MSEDAQPSRGRRRGYNFTMRITPEERAAVEAAQRAGGGPRKLGPWLVWSALRCAGTAATGLALPELGQCRLELEPGPGSAAPAGDCHGAKAVPLRSRIILDLCGGSGSWGEPYRAAGYDVRLVTLPAGDVRTFVPPAGVWGVLAAPPCTEFSRAKTVGPPRDFVRGMETVNACLRIVCQVKPCWWALENPTGRLWDFLGTPRDSWEPFEFGDPWTKRTSIWGEYRRPERGPFVDPTGSAMDRPNAAARAVTPPGFAAAFFRANP